MTIDVLVVGAGFAGSVVAERLAEAGRRVLVVDQRDHIGGNAYDEVDSHGILIHRYGPHIFHTNSELVWSYLSQFTSWIAYEHRVVAKIGDELLPIPINQDTINRLYGLDLDEEGVKQFFERVREPKAVIRTSEDVVLNAVGRDLCDQFFRGYTRKQWGRELHELSPTVLARIPTRTNRDDRYFTDRFQAMPRDGFSAMFSRMLDHPRIEVELGTSFEQVRNRISASLTVYTGRIDSYFRNCHGELPYRALQFEHQHIHNCAQLQPVAVVNYPNEFAFTRITEFKHFTGQVSTGTSVVKEYPGNEGEHCYPIPSAENQMIFKRYQDLAQSTKGVVFVGRLAQYQYFNMDQVVASALKAADRILGRVGPVLLETDENAHLVGVAER